MKLEEIMVWRSSSCRRKTHHLRSYSSSSSCHANMLDLPPPNCYNNRSLIPLSSARAAPDLLIGGVGVGDSSSSPPSWRLSKTRSTLASLLRSLLSIPIPSLQVPTCRWLSLPAGAPPSPSLRLHRKVTGTLFGHRNGPVSFSVQDHPRSQPLILIQLPTSTSTLVKEMSSGLLRIALECHKSSTRARLYSEPLWTMYCNGRRCTGYATSRTCSDFDLHVLRTVQTVSAGAGVIPQIHHPKAAAHSDGELLYMRARFDRVVGTRDSEAFYMLNPDGTGGPDLSIFLLRL